MKKLKFIIILTLSSYVITAQNVGINTTTPNPDAILEISSTNRGFLPTRSELVQTDLSNPLANHVEGITTYNTVESGNYTAVSVHDGLYYNDGARWFLMGPNAIAFGDLKNSLKTADHDGWYLLDGRNISTLSVSAQNNATSLGLTVNLINANDSYLKTIKTTETIGNINGSNQTILTQANLPNVSFNGTSDTSGDHNHLYNDIYSPTQTLGLATNVLALVPLISVNVGKPELVPANLFPTNSNGDHSHNVTVNSGGIDLPIDTTPKSIVTNVFIYLGT